MPRNFNLDDINDLMDFVTYIFERGKKLKGEYPVVGAWDWEDYAVMLMSSGDVIMTDHKEQKTMMIFSADRTKNKGIMETRGKEHRAYMLKEFLSWENLEKIDKMQEDFKPN